MKPNIKHLEDFRIKSGVWGSDASAGNNGAFEIPIVSCPIGHGKSELRVSKTPARQFRREGVPPRILRVIVSDGLGWDHVSVSLENRCPSWEEMVLIKDLFFDAEETVMQLHPPKSTYVNNCKFCLHLWKPHYQEIPRPPIGLVGIRGEDPDLPTPMPRIK